MRKLILFLAAASLVLFAEKALCYETAFSIEPESFKSLRYQDMRVEEAVPLSIRRGRFLSVDPVFDVKRSTREPQSWNRYSYVVNNPINRIDPTVAWMGTGWASLRNGDAQAAPEPRRLSSRIRSQRERRRVRP